MNEFRWFCVVVTSLQIAFVFTSFLLQVQLSISLQGFIFWYTTGLIHRGVNKSQAQVFVSKFVTLTNAKATKGNDGNCLFDWFVWIYKSLSLIPAILFLVVHLNDVCMKYRTQ